MPIFDCPDQSNSYGTFTLHFEIINTTTTAYDVTATYSGTVSGVSVTANPTRLPASSEEITEITSSTPTTQINIMVTNPNGANIDLSDITITFEEWVPTPASSFEFSFNDTDHTATIVWFAGSEIEVIIPSTVNKVNSTTATEVSDYAVTSIGNSAFSNSGGLNSIEIPDSVTSIGNNAFDVSGVTSVTFGENSQLTIIGNDAFSYCSSLTSITIPSRVISIGLNAFAGCTSLTSITIPDSVTSIGTYAFAGCSKLTTVNFENQTGWFTTNSSSATSGTPIDDLSDPAQNAEWITSVSGYYDRFWHRS